MAKKKNKMASIDSEIDPSLIHQADFCGACGSLLEDGVVHTCEEQPGRFCTQCGKQVGHQQVCYPDARRRVHIPTIFPPKLPPKPLWKS